MKSQPQKHPPRRERRPMQKLEVRLPDSIMHGIDLVAAEMFCPRAAALRSLLARALELNGTRHGR